VAFSVLLPRKKGQRNWVFFSFDIGVFSYRGDARFGAMLAAIRSSAAAEESSERFE